MQPKTSNRPVMDVAAPKSQPLPRPFSPRASVPPRAQGSASLPVRPAPLASPSQLSLNSSTSQLPASPIAARPVAKLASAPTNNNMSHRPVALITVTVFVMLVLSVLAVTVYATSQTA